MRTVSRTIGRTRVLYFLVIGRAQMIYMYSQIFLPGTGTCKILYYSYMFRTHTRTDVYMYMYVYIMYMYMYVRGG